MNSRSIAVVGLGFLGRGIAACLLGHGFRVVGYSQTAPSLADAELSIEASLAEMVEHQAATAAHGASWRRRFCGTTSFDDLAMCEFVIESVTEDAGVKNAVFNQIEQTVGPDVPIASNTSAIPISTLQKDRMHPERLLGMHWAEPAYATRFLELIRGDQTSDEAFDQAVQLGRLCGKEPSVVNRDVPGFIVNRLGYAMYREALHLLESGVADAETIDCSFRNAVGLWATFCGPLRWMDLTGGPVLYSKAMEQVLPTLSNTSEVPPTMAELSEEGANGVASGHGFYEYAPEEAARWERLFRKHAWAVKRLVDQERPLGVEQ